jgi:hypothetical protein
VLLLVQIIISIHVVDGVGAMNAADVKLALVKIQAWLVKFVRANGLDDLGNNC